MSDQPKTALAVNITGEAVRLELATTPGALPIVHHVEPGAAVEVAAGYCQRLQVEGRDPQPSIVEKLTNGRLLPASDPKAQQVLEAKKAASAPKAEAPKKS